MNNKKFKIKDYDSIGKVVEVKDFDNVATMFVEEISGDEVLNIIYFNGNIKCLDSSDSRIESFADGMSVVYVRGGFVNTEWFKEREVSMAKVTNEQKYKTAEERVRAAKKREVK